MSPITRRRPALPAPGEPSLLLTLDEAARELRCARRSVERYIAANTLPVVRLGRCVRIERSDLVAFIERQRQSHAHGAPA
ncbi:MAG TPA: helix-turn-helix domain-containing protein [Candidatus Limnocylindrales bacterium]